MGSRPSGATLDSSQIIDIRYEDLVADTANILESIYDRLNLGEFSAVRCKLEEYIDSQRDYQTNRHELEPQMRAEIRHRWAGYFERYGYSDNGDADV